MWEGAWEWGAAADSDVGDLWFVETALMLREDIGRGKRGNQKTFAFGLAW